MEATMQQQNNPKAGATKKRTGSNTQHAQKPRQQTPKPGAAGAPATQAAADKTNRRPIVGTARRRAPKKKAPQIKMFPLGGLGEIGKNMNAFECEGDMIIVDCGSLFPDSDMFGVDLVIPDFTFVEQQRDKLRAILITHGHEDHIGALPYLLKTITGVPVYATRLTIGLINNKLEEHGLRGSVDLRLITPREKLRLGCFTVDPIHMNHSIPDAVGFAIECPAGIIVHTGDFKIDFTPIGGGVADLPALADYGKKGVLALLSDSTNSEKPGMSASESKVNEGLGMLFTKASQQRIIIATFASNIYRVQQLLDLAAKHGRKVAISGRSMITNTQMALELGYLKASPDLMIDIDQINKFPPEKIALITTGSQGEPLSALSRMASNSHRQVHVGPNDCIIISATPIPGNEKMVTKTVNGLMRLGAEVIYERMYDVHASGHACQDEQKQIINLVKPKFFIPIHGEYKHQMRHAKTAQAMGIPAQNIMVADTGDTIVISRDGISLGETIQAGAVMVDGLGVGDVGSAVLRDRRLLSQDGIVVIAATVSKRSGKLTNPPELFSRGFVYVRDSEQLLEETRLAVEKVLENYSNEKHRDINSLKTRMRETASSMLYRRTKRSPMILPIVQEA